MIVLRGVAFFFGLLSAIIGSVSAAFYGVMVVVCFLSVWGIRGDDGSVASVWLSARASAAWPIIIWCRDGRINEVCGPVLHWVHS